jgi:hypothetical protein
MANLVKTKISIIGFSIVLSIVIASFDSNFFRKPSIKRWDSHDQLSWRDFQGIPAPLTTFGAVISSRVYIEFDSTSKKYRAYAGQNNMRSWTKINDDDALVHEQYHFNISELYARKLTKQFEEEQDISYETALRRLATINQQLAVYQDKYDRETDHSLLSMEQTLWEFKIDSMLQEYTINKGIAIEELNGISARFYKPSKKLKGISEDGMLYRGYGTNGYNMGFIILSCQKAGLADSKLSAIGKNIVEHDTTIMLNENNVQEEEFEYYELNRLNKNKNHEYWDRIYRYNNEIFLVEVVAPYDTLNRTYERIKNSFMNTIKFTDTKEEWISKWKSGEANKDIYYSEVLQKEDIPADSTDQIMSYCFDEDENTIFFKPPFFDADSNLHIAYAIMQHPHESVWKNVVEVGKSNVYTFIPDSTEQFTVIPNRLLPKKDFDLKFGYLLKEDSLKDCYHYYKLSGWINRN